MAQLKPEEIEIMRFLRFFGLSPERYPGKDSQREIKTVDFRVSSPRGDFFYCEQKTIKDVALSGMTPKRAQDKIKNALEKAFEQFSSVNPSRLVPNVMAWKSTNPQINNENICHLIEGKIEIFGNTIDLSFYQSRARVYIRAVDLHVFMHAWGPPSLIYTPRDQNFLNRLRSIFSDEQLQKWDER